LGCLAMAPPIGSRGTWQPRRSSVAGRTRLLDPCRTCREADRQSTGTVVLLSEVADRDSAEAISPALAPGAFPTPPRAWGPAATSTDSPVPLLRTGPDVETRPKSPSGGIRAKEIKVACGMSSPRRTARGTYYARPIGHSEDRKVALNRNYCRSVTIQTLALKAIYLGSELTYSTSHCAPAAPQRLRDCGS
jgi:hypothetical protein